MKKRYIVSACLLGEACKYNGESNFNDRLAYFNNLGVVVGVCPEVLGGLPTPRTPSEIVDHFVMSEDGNDVTEAFINGADRTLEIAQHFGITKAIFKTKSPSCGNGYVYDGTFSHRIIEGDGITTALLKDNKFKVFDETTLPFYDAIIVAAGSSTRANISYNKIFEGSSKGFVIEHSIEPFLGDFECNKVIIVANKNEIPYLSALFNDERIEIFEGGNSREESVLNGLKHSTSHYVLIHDGARPYIDDEVKDRVLDELKLNGINAIPYINHHPLHLFDFKDGDKSIQTPQGFDKDLLMRVMEQEDIASFRDESSMFKKHYPINYVYGSEKNKKITIFDDIKEWRNH